MGCVVRTECLADALDNRVEFGVWGGMTERERRALLKRRPNVRRGGACSRPRAPSTAAGRGPGAPSPAELGSPAHRPSAPAEVLADRAQAVEVVDVVRPGRHRAPPAPSGARPGTARASCCSRLGDPHPVGVQPQQLRGQVVPAGARSSCSAAGEARSADRTTAPAVHPVEHQPGQRHPLRAEPVHEVRRLAQRVALGSGDHDERRPGRLEQPVGRVGPLAEAAEHRVERRHERLHVAQHLGAQHLGQRRA